MRFIVIAICRDFGSPVTDGPAPDGPVYMTPLTRLDISPPFGLGGHLRIDQVDVGPVVSVSIDHEDEKAPLVEAEA